MVNEFGAASTMRMAGWAVEAECAGELHRAEDVVDTTPKTDEPSHSVRRTVIRRATSTDPSSVPP